MPTPTTYTFTQEVDYTSVLQASIQTSSIAVSLASIGTLGTGSSMVVSVNFNDVLSSGDQTTLTSIMSSYVNTSPAISTPTVSISSISALPAAPAFATNTYGTKALYVAMTGIQQTLTVGSNTIIFTIPYPQAEISGLGIVGCECLDTVSMSVLDTTTGTYSGHANYLLNQFGFNVNLPAGDYEYEASYTSTLYQNMQIQLIYTSLSAKTIGINFILNQVK